MGSRIKFGNTIFGGNPEIPLFISQNRLDYIVNQSFGSSVMFIFQRAIVILRLTKIQSRTGRTNPHPPFRIPIDTLDFITAKLSVCITEKMIIISICNQWIRMKNTNTLTGSYPHHPICVFFYHTHHPHPECLLEEMTEFIFTVGSRFSQFQPTAKCSYPHAVFTVAINGKNVIIG